MSEEVTNAITQLKGLLNKYPNRQIEILQYVFGKDTIRKIINKPTYDELQQENKQYKEVIEEIRKIVKVEKEKMGYAVYDSCLLFIEEVLDKVDKNHVY